MRLDPRRNLAATGAGLFALVFFVVPWLLDQYAPIGPGRLALLAAGVAGLLAGAWPSRRVRFVLLIGVTLTFVIVGILALWSIGLAILLAAGFAVYGLLMEYAREGRD